MGSGPTYSDHPRPRRPDTFSCQPPPIGDLLAALAAEAERIAAGKKLCGMCDFKTGMKKKWQCLHSPRFTCPVPDPQAGCLGYRQSGRSRRRPIAQPKKKGLPVPQGMKFYYYGRPRKGSNDHHGVVTVAWIESSPGTLVMGFSFCSPEDPWCKIAGRELAMKRLYEHPLVMPYLYSPKRTVHETVRAVVTHDFMRIAALSPGATMLGMVPSWTKDLAKRLMGGTDLNLLDRILKGCTWSRLDKPIEIPLTIIAQMMREIASLGNG